MKSLVHVVTLVAVCALTGCDEDPTRPNRAPSKPSIIASSLEINSASQCSMTAAATDPDGDALAYAWSATGGSFDTATQPSVVWTAPAVTEVQEYTISVVVSDTEGASAANSVNVTVVPESGGCVGHEVHQKCDGDFVCHFEGEYCGTALGGEQLGSGTWGQGLHVNGGRGVDIGDDDAYSQSDLEVEFQVKFTDLPDPGDHAGGLVTKYVNGSASRSEWGVWVEGNRPPSVPMWMLTGDGTSSLLSQPDLIETGVLYCVRAVFQGGYAELWVNGELIVSGPMNRNPANTSTHVMVGNSSSGANRFYGMIDEIRIGCVRSD